MARHGSTSATERHARAAAQLRAIAVDAGYPSLTKLAAAAGVDRLTLRLALRGERAPRSATIDRLATALAVPRNFIVFIFTCARGEP